MCVYVCENTPLRGYPQSLEEGVGAAGAGVTGGWELSNIGAEN